MDSKDKLYYCSIINHLKTIIMTKLTAALFLNENLVELKSVGSWIDTKTLLTYPSNVSGMPIIEDDEEFHLTDCCPEWFSDLDGKDADIIKKLLK